MLSLVVVVAVALGAPEWERPRAPERAPRVSSRLLTIAADAFDGMMVNGLLQDLPTLPLTGEALSTGEIGAVLDADPESQNLVKYLVQCALPADVSLAIPLAGGTLELHGQAGMAPEWAEGPCDEACQEWVTACLLARTNAYGVSVALFIGGKWPGAPVVPSDGADDGVAYVQEGAFYGNYFTDPARRYACRGTGYDPLMMVFRRCAEPGALCGFQWVGACGDVDGDTGVGVTRRACEPEVDGLYPSCWNRAREGGVVVEPQRAYTRVVTTYLQTTRWSPCPEGAPAWDVSSSLRPDPAEGNTCPKGHARSCAGARCVNDDGCDSERLTCDTAGPELGWCTARCSDAAPEVEAAACGGAGTTCLTFDDEPDGQSFCTAACDPKATTVADGACPPWQVCTGFWWRHEDGADDPGCFPYCRDDADCVEGSFCNRRLPGCTAEPPDDARLADGEPCRLDADRNECRGSCWWTVDPSDPRGICASMIDFSQSLKCADDPTHVYPSGDPAADALGICLYRTCQRDEECTPPLACVLQNGGVCNYPD